MKWNKLVIILGMVGLVFSTLTKDLYSDMSEVEDLLEGDLAAKRNTEEGLTELIEMIEAELDADPDSYSANWMYAALLYFYGDFYVEDEKVKKEYFTKCKDYAEDAVELNPYDAAGHYWLGVGYAMWSQANGILKSLFYADDVVDEMTKCIEIDPSYFKGTPFAVRAKVYSFAPGGIISVGDTEKAYEDLESAFEYGSDYRVIYQIAAEVYMNEKEWELAKETIEKGLALPIDELRIMEDTLCKETLEEYLDEVEEEL